MSTLGYQPPYSIIPNQADPGVPHAQAGRVSPPRVAPQNVDMQFGDVVNKKKAQDKELENIRRLYEEKSRECDELSDKITAMNSYTDQYKKRLTDEKETLKDEHQTEMTRLQAEHDRERKQFSEQLIKLKRQASSQAEDLRSSQVTTREEVRRLQDENARLVSISEQCKQEANRAVNDMELDLDRQGTLLNEKEREVSLKDEQIKKAKKEVALMKENFERIAKELVVRNKERDESIVKRRQHHELEAQRMASEINSLVEDKKEWLRQEMQQKEEILVLKAQWDKAQTINNELKQDIENLRTSLESKHQTEDINVREVNDALQQLEVMKEENNGLHEMNDRLNEQLRRAHEDITRTEEQAGKQRDQVAEMEEDMTAFHRERGSFAAKMVRAIETTMSEAMRLVEEVDEFRSVIREAAMLHAPQETRDLEMELLREQARERELQLQQRSAPLQHGDERACVTLMGRLRDDVILAWEDLRVVKSDVRDEISRFNDLHTQHSALKEAYVVDREHLATLTTNLNEANTAFAKLQKDKEALQKCLKENDDKMHEFVGLSKEMDDFKSNHAAENNRLAQELSKAKEYNDGLQAELLELERRQGAVRTENERLAKEAWDAMQTKADAEAKETINRDEVMRLQNELQGLKMTQSRTTAEQGDTKLRLGELETECEVTKRQLREAHMQTENMKRKERDADAENKDLRDENFVLRRKMDELQRRIKQVESDAYSYGAGQGMLSDQLANEKVLSNAIRQSRDDADHKVLHLEQEKQHLSGAVGDLRREVEALHHGMRDATVENDQYKEAMRTQASPATLSSAFQSPGVTPVRVASGHSGPAAGAPRSSAFMSQDEALRNIEERVTSLLSSRKTEMASWGGN